MDLTIRPAVETEASAMRVLARSSKAYWGYSDEFMRRWDYDDEITEQFITDRHVFCADANGALAGFYALSDERPNPRLEHLWVAPGIIGRGVGRALFDHAVEQASSRGASSIVVHADPHVAPFYEPLGARRVGEIHDAKLRQVFPVLELSVGGGLTRRCS
jgi:GNAT superfamily N-acetyltransferase